MRKNGRHLLKMSAVRFLTVRHDAAFRRVKGGDGRVVRIIKCHHETDLRGYQYQFGF